MHNKRLRTAGIVVGVILVIGLIVGTLWLRTLRRSYPKTRGTIEVEGLSAPVDIYRDEYGVPHIYAETAEDLFFAQGYVHAQERFWQMEFWRRIGSGRLSELFGEATLGSDIYLRTMGFRRIAEIEYEQMEDGSRMILDSYSAGVNAYILDRDPADLGLEFALLGLQGVDVEIEPWTPINTLTWAKVMAYDLGGNMDDELERIELIRAVGLEMTADFIPEFRSDFPVIVSDEELKALNIQPGEASTGGAASEGSLPSPYTLVGGFDPQAALAFGKGSGIGSNSWVISGELTDTGMPILANDPHLGIQMPSIWFEVGLHCVEKSEGCPYDLRGYSFAGTPGIVIGHNDRIAWGFTNVGPDVQDLYIERINPANPDQYEVNGEWVDMDIVDEMIVVQGQDEPYHLRIRSTRHGPVITDMEGWAGSSSFSLPESPQNIPAELQLSALALQWTALEPTRTFESIWALNAAQNFDEFREALSLFGAPAQNMIYADVEGNIGYQTPGLIPIRANGDGSLPVPGWNDDYAWTGTIPFDDLPRIYNPAVGYIATANQPVVTNAYPYLLGTEFDHGYRADRVVQMIEAAGDDISIEDIAAMQADNLNVSALEIIPYLEDVRLDDPDLEAARDRLLAWNGQQDMDSPEAALYEFFWVALLDETFDDQLPESLWPSGDGRSRSAVYFLLKEPSNPWWDDISTPGETETRDDILAKAFEKGYQQAVEAMGDNLAKWRWGDVHTATFDNQTFGQSGIGLIEAIFNRGPVATGGGESIVNATAWDADDPFDVFRVPSMRQIIDLGDLGNSWMMHTTGQSGHPGHRHYDDFIDSWRFVTYHPTLWERETVEAEARDHMVLTPAN